MAREVLLVILVTVASLCVDAGQRARQVPNAGHRQIQQFQIGLQLPPGTQVHPGSQPPPARPGFVWIQVPATSSPGQQGNYPQPPQNPGSYPQPPQNPGSYPQPPQNPGSYPQPPQNPGSYPQLPQNPGSYPPPSQPPPQVGGDTFRPPPPPSYPSAPAAPLPPYPGNQPIKPISDEVFPEGEAPDLSPGQETGAEPPSPLLQHCKAEQGQFPSPNSCNNFINCWYGIVVEQQCPGGLAFNVGGFCDYPENVDCSDRGGPSQVESMEENAVCPTPYGSYRSSQSCGIFYVCVNGKPFKFDCPVGLNYNTELGVCDYPYNVDCRGTPSERPAPEIPDYEAPAPIPEENVGEEVPPPDPATFEGEKHKYYGGLNKVPANVIDSRVPCRSNAVFRLNPSCSSVSVCRNGYSTVINCSGGTAWDSRANNCINVYKARC